MANRILDDVPGETTPPGVRIAVRGWIGFAEAASLEWLEHRELSRDELRDLLIQALRGAVGAAASHYAVRRSSAGCGAARRFKHHRGEAVPGRRDRARSRGELPRRMVDCVAPGHTVDDG